MRFLALALAPLLLNGQAINQLSGRKAGPLPSYEAHFTAAPVVIDGKLDDAAWKTAAAATLGFPWDVQTGAKQKTVVKLAWDASYLYVAYDCEDNDITARFLQRDDPVYQDDTVEIYLNPDTKQQLSYYGFEMNARGVYYDYFHVYPSIYLRAVDFEGIRIATQIRGTLNQREDQDLGWSMEFAIPWSGSADYGRVPKPGAEWGMNLVRWDGVPPARRLSVWSDSLLERPHPHNPARLGTLRFVE